MDKSKWPSYLTVLLPATIAVIKTEAHFKEAKPQHQGNAFSHFHAKAAAMEEQQPPQRWCTCGPRPLRFCKKLSLLPDYYHLDVLAAWQQAVPESEKSHWANSICKLNEQSDPWETQGAHWFFKAPWKTPFFTFCIPLPTMMQLRWLKW